MTFEEWVLDVYHVDIDDVCTIEDLELQLAPVTSDPIEELLQQYNDYCAENNELLTTPDYLDEFF